MTLRRPPLRRNMPTIATVSGAKVLIFYNDHAPPHVHLSKGDMDIVVDINAPSLPPWAFSRAERRAILDWMKTRKADLLAAWARACAGESPGSVE